MVIKDSTADNSILSEFFFAMKTCSLLEETAVSSAELLRVYHGQFTLAILYFANQKSYPES